MVKADCLNPSHGSFCARLTGEKGIDACVQCCTEIPLVYAELPLEPAHKEWENDVTGAYVHTSCPA
jgi:hypothetical protein